MDMSEVDAPNAKKRKLDEITPEPTNGNGVEITMLNAATNAPSYSEQAAATPFLTQTDQTFNPTASAPSHPLSASGGIQASLTQPDMTEASAAASQPGSLEPMFPFRFKENSTVEFIIPDEESYYSFAWIEVKILRRGVRRVGEYNLPYYVVSYGSEQSTVEEWQMRETSRESRGLANMRVRKGSFVEVQSAFVDSEEKQTTCWFMARVMEESQHKDLTVKVEYKNTKWNLYGENDKTIIDKSRLRLPPTACLTQGLTKMAWGLNSTKLPIRLLSDEEHKIPDMHTRFLAIEVQLTAQPPSTPFEFEAVREELNELIDSFNNARYYEYSKRAVDFILRIEKGMDKGRK